MLENIFSKMDITKFSWISALLCLLGDLTISGYLYVRFDQYDLFLDRYHEALTVMGQDPSIIPPNFVREQFLLFMQMLAIMLILVIIMHLCIYIFYFLGKKMARGYIIVLCWMGVPGALLLFASAIGGKVPWGYYFLPQAIFYIFTILGIRHFYRKSSEKSELPAGTP